LYSTVPEIQDGAAILFLRLCRLICGKIRFSDNATYPLRRYAAADILCSRSRETIPRTTSPR
jgi:hypothetical protein